jgi:hypothetical protein
MTLNNYVGEMVRERAQRAVANLGQFRGVSVPDRVREQRGRPARVGQHMGQQLGG